MYSERLQELFRTADHAGPLEDATHYGAAGVPGQGPCVQIWLRAAKERVEAARWKAWGCPAAIACSEAVCRWSEGRSLAEAAAVTPGQVAAWVGPLPEGKEHCPELAAGALESALAGKSRGAKADA